MHRTPHWTTALATKFYSARAGLHPDSWETRFNWEAREEDGSDGFTQAEMDAIYAEIIAKIPPGVTRVLEVGCGDGRFGDAFKAANPGIEYRGLDIIPENIERAQANYPTLDFVVGNAWEYLSSATVDWDFVVSIGCVLHCTEDPERMFQLLDAKSPKGFFILADNRVATAPLLSSEMTEVATASTNVAESYHEGARDFLSDVTLKGILTPFYIHREATSTTAPTMLPRLCVVETGTLNRVLARTHARLTMKDGSAKPTEFKGIESTGGLVDSITSAKAIEVEWVEKLPTRRAPVIDPPPET